jgi:putative FmdB family regulatory protein
MPIFEFRCLECNDRFELLFLKEDDPVEMRCPHCQATNFERVMSSTSYVMGSGGGGGKGTSTTNRSCASGNCTTYEIPGPG